MKEGEPILFISRIEEEEKRPKRSCLEVGGLTLKCMENDKWESFIDPNFGNSQKAHKILNLFKKS